MKEYLKPTAESIELRPEERLAAGSDLGGGSINCASTPGNSAKPECSLNTEAGTTPSHENKPV